MTLVVPGGAATQGYGKVADRVSTSSTVNLPMLTYGTCRLLSPRIRSAADYNETNQWRYKVPLSRIEPLNSDN